MESQNATEIEKIKEWIDDNSAIIKALAYQMEEKEEMFIRIIELSSQVERQTTEILELTTQVKVQNAEIYELSAQVTGQKKEIRKFHKQVKENRDVVSDPEWKDNVENWIIKTDKKQNKMTATMLDLTEWKDNVDNWIIETEEKQEISDKKRNMKNVNFSIKRSYGNITFIDENDDLHILDDMHVFINGKLRKPSTVYARKDELVSYDLGINDKRMINFSTGYDISDYKKPKRSRSTRQEGENTKPSKDKSSKADIDPPRLPRHKGDEPTKIPKRQKSKPLSRKERDEMDEEMHRSALLQKDPPIEDKEEYVKPPEVNFRISDRTGTYIFFDKTHSAHILELMDLFIDGRYSSLSKVIERQHEFISYEMDEDDKDVLDFITNKQK